MRKKVVYIFIVISGICLAGCSNVNDANKTAQNQLVEDNSEMIENSSTTSESINKDNSSTTSETTNEQEEIKMIIQVGDNSFHVTLADNSSAQALVEYLSNGPVTIYLEDYAGMEKVGDLGTTLPRNDEQINTSAGDIILYQGRNFVIYYGTNSWSLTRLGKIDDVTASELKEALGDGDVEVTLSIE